MLLPGAGDSARPAWKPAHRRVLVVDDEPLVRWAVAETLTAAGYDVEEAADGRTAVRSLLDHADPDVVMLDLRLPDSSDLGLLATVRRLAPRALVILMTAFGTADVRDDAPRLGASFVLDKPFDVEELDVLISRLIARQ
jgi:DNA-binding NtrC family response regulator